MKNKIIRIVLRVSMSAGWLSAFLAWMEKDYARAALFMFAGLWARIELLAGEER